jgi:2-keto-4-pentenoate hydratase/2-oxohepta-3-ene-1,7-dioic acid hydratase in catechol pathway
MRLAAVEGRTCIVTDDGIIDVETESQGTFGPDTMSLLARWPEFRAWADGHDPAAVVPLGDTAFDCPVPRPAQVFGIGLNYRAHAIEAGMAIPEVPLVFTKFASSVTGPVGTISVPTPMTDWEVELAVVMGRPGHHIRAAEAWDHVAGVTLAQDFSARDVQFTPASAPQFSMGKSFPGFLPLGPVVVTPDELADPDAVHLWCEVDGVMRQSGCTDDLVFSVPQLIEYLSSIVRLLPGDLILTGTPSGVGVGCDPAVFLEPGHVVRTGSPEIGEMHHVMV